MMFEYTLANLEPNCGRLPRIYGVKEELRNDAKNRDKIQWNYLSGLLKSMVIVPQIRHWGRRELCYDNQD